MFPWQRLRQIGQEDLQHVRQEPGRDHQLQGTHGRDVRHVQWNTWRQSQRNISGVSFYRGGYFVVFTSPMPPFLAKLWPQGRSAKKCRSTYTPAAATVDAERKIFQWMLPKSNHVTILELKQLAMELLPMTNLLLLSENHPYMGLLGVIFRVILGVIRGFGSS